MATDTVRAAGTLDLTVHRRDPHAKPHLRVQGRYSTNTDVREYDGNFGKTLCGARLATDQLWVDYEPEDRDPLCPRCFTEPSDDRR